MLGSIVRKVTLEPNKLMPIQQSKKQSDLEKRLKILRRQVYGKNIALSDTPIQQYSDAMMHRTTGTLASPDASYLYRDLSKILVLALVALTIQFSLFILLKNHIISLNF